MIAVAQSQFDYAALERSDAEYLREKTGEIRQLARAASESIMLIGAALIDVKERLEHGYFLPWLEAEFNWSERSAQNFIQVARAFKSANFADLQIDPSALYLLAAPSVPEAVRAEVIARAEGGEHVTHATAKAILSKLPEVIEKQVERYVR